MQENRALVIAADRELFNDHDLTTLDRSFAADFVDHSSGSNGGAQGLEELVTKSSDDLRHNVVRVIADGDLVALHGSYPGLAEPVPLGFDIFRVQNGKISERWGGLIDEASPNASGRTQLDGERQPDPLVDTEASRKLVLEFWADVLKNQNYAGVPQYTDGDRFAQHSPDISDGAANMQEFLEQLKNDGAPLVYDRLLRHVAQNDFVLTHSEGSIGGERHFFFELWRVENGKVAELWDAVGPLPASTPTSAAYNTV